MPVLINFKICDNSQDCSGISACSTSAFYWDEKNKTIAVDNDKCTSCGQCEEACPVGAIRVAKDEIEFQKIKAEIDSDLRKVFDLFIDRYGAQPIHPAFLISPEEFEIQILKANKLAVVELFNKNSIECLLNSITIKNLFAGFDIKYRKIMAQDDSLIKKYKVEKLPALLFFKDGKLIGKIEGYYDAKREGEMKEKINQLISRV